MPRNEDIFEEAKNLFLAGNPIDEVLRFLWKAGIPQGMCSFMLQAMGAGTHEECKDIVIDSELWSSLKQSNIDLQNAASDFDNESNCSG